MDLAGRFYIGRRIAAFMGAVLRPLLIADIYRMLLKNHREKGIGRSALKGTDADGLDEDGQSNNSRYHVEVQKRMIARALGELC